MFLSQRPVSETISSEHRPVETNGQRFQIGIDLIVAVFELFDRDETGPPVDLIGRVVEKFHDARHEAFHGRIGVPLFFVGCQQTRQFGHPQKPLRDILLDLSCRGRRIPVIEQVADDGDSDQRFGKHDRAVGVSLPFHRFRYLTEYSPCRFPEIVFMPSDVCVCERMAEFMHDRREHFRREYGIAVRVEHPCAHDRKNIPCTVGPVNG